MHDDILGPGRKAKTRRAESYAVGYAEGYVIGYAEGVAATKQRYESWLAKVAAEKGIPLADLLPPQSAG